MSDVQPLRSLSTPCAHVMVVDGDAAVFHVLEGVLQRRGFSVVHEHSPLRALGLLTTEDVDIVICDLNMEEVDGHDFVKRLRRIQPDVPVLLMTGKKTMELAIHAVLTGAWDYLLKPVNTTELILAMDRACRHRGVARALSDLQHKAAVVSDPGGR